ncbi:MAG: NAD(P)-dependent oxidoreductase [Nitrososphaera sp.]|uniref:2-hydroxy-3-oxopropionate reductase n=1 Tax=Nitrososphaera gargensis (strain Ga9.2) TaxID=1237085 RepID=K0IE26_NITGG|nr:NAD(P)-dependent oxidoreductase [Candidatus Nitrososphaera gargensis]AFU58020.1 2-hydroxy-3-oxopropionate reductase [Candidatus Nitrososphaera gargensis Ga9.2]
MMKVGVVGLGLMGSGIATRLASTGHLMSVYNRSSEKARRFSKSASIASSPKELADNCDLVITVVTDFDAVKDVLLGKGGVIESTNRDLIVADASTISPMQSEHCARELRRAGIEMLGMPVMGGPAAAEAGDLVPMVAGRRQAFEKAKTVIEKLGKTFYIGERDGSANAIKLALNLNIALIASAVSEGITLAKGSGIDPAIFVQILNSTYFKTGLSEKKGPKMVKNDFTPSFHLKNMLKDLELATGTAQAAGITLPQTALAQQIFRAANNSGFSEQDYTSICAFLAKINGMEK